MTSRVRSQGLEAGRNIKVDLKAEECLAKGLKPCKVEINVKRWIDGACKAKHNWDDTLRSIGPYVLNVFIVHVRDENLTTMADLRGQMDVQYEFLHMNPLSIKGFENSVHRFWNESVFY